MQNFIVIIGLIISSIISIKETLKVADKKVLFIFLICISLSIFYLLDTNRINSNYILIILPILIAHFIIDLKIKELPDKLNLLIAVAGLISIIYYYFHSHMSKVILISHVKTSIIIFVIYFIIALITGGALGGGDVKLIGALGLFIPFEYFIKLLIYPFFIGAVQALILLIVFKKNGSDSFAFGPAIILSFIIITSV